MPRALACREREQAGDERGKAEKKAETDAPDHHHGVVIQ
jgi:hypothetical protein